MNSPFQMGGALSADAVSYIDRDADRQILEVLRRMEYVLIIEPRQQGKTSLVMRTRAQLMQEGYLFAYVDITDFEQSGEAVWYADFWEELALQLATALELQNMQVTRSREWREALRVIARQAEIAGKRVVVVLDEIGAFSRAAWAEAFFKPIRKIYNQRSSEQMFTWLSFMLCGCFHPRDLIRDESVSPFNISQRVRLPDFTIEQTSQMVLLLGIPENHVIPLAERIYQWTGGQPYLTQVLCSLLRGESLNSANNSVDRAVERLRREDENHLPPVLARLEREPELRNYLRQIHDGMRVQFYPSENRRHKQLELLGVVKADAEGFCVIRNLLYSQVLFSSHSTLATNTWADGAASDKYAHVNQPGNHGEPEQGAELAQGIFGIGSLKADIQLFRSLVEMLLQIPASHSAEGRTGWLSGLSFASSMRRDHSNPRTDLELIINQLLRLGGPSSADAPIHVFLENAVSHVAGTSLAHKLAEARETLSKLPA